MKQLLLILALGILLVVLSACLHTPCRNCTYKDHMAAHFDKRNCRDLPGGQFRCDDVTFVPGTLDVRQH